MSSGRTPSDHWMVCQNPACGVKFRVEPSQLAKRKYCSRACSTQTTMPQRVLARPAPTPRVPRLAIICRNPECHAVFHVAPGEAARLFCSITCSARGRVLGIRKETHDG